MAMKPTQCRYCYEPIDRRATVCPACGREQRRIWNLVSRAENLGVFVSVLLMVLAFFQYKEARTERSQADKALVEARAAQVSAVAAAEAAESAHQAALEVSVRMRDEELSTVSCVYLLAATKNEFNTTRAKAAQQVILGELNLLLGRAIPEPGERSEWISDLLGRIPTAPEH